MEIKPGVLRTPDARFAALPPEEQPETGPRKELPPQFRRTLVDYKTKEPPGTLIVDTQNTYLYLVLEKGKRFSREDFPKSNWDLRRWMWMPRLRLLAAELSTAFQ